MLIVPEEIKETFKADNRRADTARTIRLRFYDEEVKLLYPEETLFPDDELFPIDQEPVYVIDNYQISNETLTITESICDSQDITFGSCDAAQFEITVADVLLDLTGKEFMATVEIAGYEMALGIYTVDSFVRQADRRLKKITGYDRMKKFDVDVSEWYNGLTFPMTLRQFRDLLCAHIGITQIDTTLPLDGLVVTKTIEPEQLSGRDVLKAICEINGGFGHIDKTGRLTYAFLPKAGLFPAETLYPDDDLFPADMADSDNTETLSHYNQSQTTYEDYVVTPIERVQIRQEEGDVGAIYGDGSNTYVIQGNFLVYGKSAEELLSIAMTAYDQISGRTYKPCKIVGPALPWVEVGDGLVCYTSDDVIETYCLKRTIKGMQKMIDTYTVKGSIAREVNFGIQAQIIQLAGKAAVIKKSVEEVSVRVEDLKEYTEAQVTILANEISAEVKRATEAEAAIIIRADEIALSVKDLKEYAEAQIVILADQISMKVSIGDVTNQVNSELQITGNYIKFTTGSLIIEAKNFQLDKNGNATFSGDIRGANIYGSNIEGGTIDIGNGTFMVDQDGAVYIDSGEIEIGGIKINENYADLGAFRVSSADYGLFCSINGEIYLSTSKWDSTGPSLELSKGNYKTRMGFGGVDTNGDIYCRDIYLSGSWWDGWSLTEEIKLLHNAVFG